MSDPVTEALRDLNNAAYRVLRAGRDTAQYPDLNREALREIVRATDNLVETRGKEA